MRDILRIRFASPLKVTTYQLHEIEPRGPSSSHFSVCFSVFVHLRQRSCGVCVDVLRFVHLTGVAVSSGRFEETVVTAVVFVCPCVQLDLVGIRDWIRPRLLSSPGWFRAKEVRVTLRREPEVESRHAAVSNVSVLKRQWADLKQDPVDYIKEPELSPVSFSWLPILNTHTRSELRISL